jgi:DNA-nicking Smr family endonuclease
MKLDLHGVKHSEVSSQVDSFIWDAIQRNMYEVEIITGNSIQMKNIVRECVNDYGFNCAQAYLNSGTLIVALV